MHDFEATYTGLSGATVVESSGRGVRIAIADDCTTEATVSVSVAGPVDNGGVYEDGAVELDAPYTLACSTPSGTSARAAARAS